MSLLHFFFAPHGRISRLAFWLGLVVLTAISIPVSILLDPDAMMPTGDRIRPPSLALTVWSLMLSWPTAAVSIKRFNDRDWPPWPGYLLFGAMVVMVICHHHGVLLDFTTAPPWEKLAFSALLMFTLWTLVDNGFYQGTSGPNRYGPDPLEQRPHANF